MGLSIKKDFNITENYKIITKKKFLKIIKEKVHKKNFLESKKDFNEFVIIAEDKGDINSLITFHLDEIERKLNILRFYIPAITHPSFKYSIKIAKKPYNEFYAVIGINEKNNGNYKNGLTDFHSNIMYFDESIYNQNQKSIRSLLKKFKYNQLSKILETKNELNSCLETTINWASLVSSNQQLQNKLLYIVFAFEVLFTNENNNYSSITASVSEKVALLIGKKGEQEKLFKEVKELYDKRSKVVHGSNNIIINRYDVEIGYDILFNCILKIISLIQKESWSKKEDLNNYFLKKKFH